MRPDLTRECAGGGPDVVVDLSPKEVAQVRILPGALTNPQVSPYFASSSGLHLDHCWQGVGRPDRDGTDLDGVDVTIDRQAMRVGPVC